MDEQDSVLACAVASTYVPVLCTSRSTRLLAVKVTIQMRVLHRFNKQGHCAEIRERTVSQFRAIEFLVFIDDSLLEVEMFHDGRETEYPGAMADRIRSFVERGWTHEALPTEAN